jgi:hypothetical protein
MMISTDTSLTCGIDVGKAIGNVHNT